MDNKFSTRNDDGFFQGILEFLYPDSRFRVESSSGEYDIFGHGGMLFWFATSVFFCVVSYIFIKYIFYLFSVGTIFIRQNLMAVDVRF